MTGLGEYEESEPRQVTTFFRARPTWHLLCISAMHAVNDALFSGIYPLLPLVAVELGLTYGQVGALKGVLGASSALLQVPAGLLAEVIGEHLLLTIGTVWVGVGLGAMALATTFVPLLFLTAAAGVGGNIQHPVANAAVARRFDDENRPSAIGTLNFAGDVGKIASPFVAGVGAALGGWHGGLIALSILGVGFALLYSVAVPVRTVGRGSGSVVVSSTSAGPRLPLWSARAWGIRHGRGFAALTVIGILDSGARGSALALIPFVMTRAGMDSSQVGFAFAILFGAGAAGKFLCGPLGVRVGLVWTIIATEIVTAVGVGVIPLASASGIMWAILPFGFSLNGTSTVLYSLVARLSHPEQRGRAYGLFYTTSLLATATAPMAYGTLADVASLETSLVSLGLITLLVIPVVWHWRGHLLADH